ncbi:MAG: hypothetical protein ACLUJG_07160 [Lawsonibacter sp.]
MPYDDDRRLTPVMRDGEARYIGDQEIDSARSYAVFQWSDFGRIRALENYQSIIFLFRSFGRYGQIELSDAGGL